MGTATPLPLNPTAMIMARNQIASWFPQLVNRFIVTSIDTDEYNCIAWAAVDVDNWWWPTNPDRYWPTGIQRSETVEAFTEAFGTIGYEPCADGSLEAGLEKLALYGIAGIPKHMARQLPTGQWTSKLGSAWDIVHFDIDGVSGTTYGSPIAFFARKSGT